MLQKKMIKSLAALTATVLFTGMMGTAVAEPPAAGGPDSGHSVSGQQAEPTGKLGTVTGQVVDRQGRPVTKASVHAARTQQYELSDDEGRFSLTDVPTGSPSIIASREGYDFATVQRDGAASTKIVLSRLKTAPRSEYPRPDADRRPFTHDAWESLNGTWSFDFDQEGKGEKEKWFAPDHEFGKAIRVPFAYQTMAAFGEESLATDDIYRSAFDDYNGTVWYRRSFTVPSKGFSDQHTQLRIGATSWGAGVWLDGREVLPYEDTGDTEIKIDLGALKPGSTHAVVIKVNSHAATQDATYPIGRRDRFNNVGGIWQSVWIEPVSSSTLETPEIDSQVKFTGTDRQPVGAAAQVSVAAAGAVEATTATVVVRDPAGKKVGTQDVSLTAGKATAEFDVADPQLWDIGQPRLYTADVTLKAADGQQLDGVRSTFGLRKIERRAAPAGDGSYQYVYLNNRPVFLRGALDQGNNPWGGSTATGVTAGGDLHGGTVKDPERGSILYDLKGVQKQGFNLIRSHVKVNEPSYYHWADKLGLLVWYEMPNPGRSGFGDAYINHYKHLINKVMHRDYNHPSVIIWTTFNESWGVGEGTGELFPEAVPFVKAMAALVRKTNPNVLVNDNTGANGHTSETDINDVHAGFTGYQAWKDFLDPYEGKVHPGSDYNFSEGTQQGQPWMLGEMSLLRGSETGTVSALRSYPKMNGYMHVQLADQEDEMVSQLTFDRLDRGPMFIDHLGKKRGVDLINSDDAVSILRNATTTIKPGAKLELPLSLSHFSDHDLSQATLRWKVAGTDESGNWVDPKVGGQRTLDVPNYQVSDTDPVSVQVPKELRTGYVWVWLESGHQTVAENLLTFDTKDQSQAAFDVLKPDRQQWSGGGTTNTDNDSAQLIGHGLGFAEYTATVPAAAKKGGTLQFEASSAEAPNQNNSIQATGARKFPTKVTVSVNGKKIKGQVVPDDPMDPLGLASRARGIYGDGLGNHYGYRISVPLSEEIIGQQDEVVVRIASDGGGLRLFGADTGTIGLAPRIIAGQAKTPIAQQSPTADDRPGISVSSAVLNEEREGVVVVSAVNDGKRSLRGVTTQLDLPEGWTVTPMDDQVGDDQVGDDQVVRPLKSGDYRHVAYRIKAADHVAPGSVTTLTATVRWIDGRTPRSIQQVNQQEVAFDPDGFATELFSDDFAHDSTADYATFAPSGSEVLPQLSFGGGTLQAQEGKAFYGLVAHQAPEAAGQASVVMVTSDHFIGNSPGQDALFMGLVKDERNYVLAWTGQNGTGGIDVMTNGKLAGTCCGSGPAIQPGTRWAIVFDGNTVSTYIEGEHGWVRAMSSDTKGSVDLADPKIRSQYHSAVGFRGQTGTQAIRSLSARTVGGG